MRADSRLCVESGGYCALLSVCHTYNQAHMNESVEPNPAPEASDDDAVVPYNRTLKAAYRAQLEGNRFYPKAGEIVEMDFALGSLGLAARKMLLLLLQKAGGDAWQDKTFTITKKELRGSHDSNDRVSDGLDELMNVKVKLKTTSSRNRAAVLTTGLIEWNIEEVSDDGMSIVEYRLSEPARVAIAGSDYYAQIRVAVAMAFQSKYAFSLYELGSLYLRRRDRTWKGTVAEFRAKIGVPENIYLNFAFLRREVLEKAKAEIDQLADFTMSWAEVRGDGRGRPVKSVILSFEPKEAALVDAAADELDRPKIGRQARRDGTVEQVVDTKVVAIGEARTFPTGSLRFCGDDRLLAAVLDFGGGWDRDYIAEAYRGHMGESLSGLKGDRLYRSWEGFCKSFVSKRGRA
jgi:Initiator Replication protein